MARGYQFASGVALALAIAIMPSLVLAVPLLYWHARRAVLGSLVGAIVVAGLSVLFMGWSAHSAYLAHVLPCISNHGVACLASALLGVLTYVLCASRVRALPRIADLGVDILGLSWLIATISRFAEVESSYAPGIFCVAWVYRRHATANVVPEESLESTMFAFAIAAIPMAAYFQGATPGQPIAVPYQLLGGLLFGVVWLIDLQGNESRRALVERLRRVRRGLLPVSQAASRWMEAAVLVACASVGGYLIANLLLFQYGRDQSIYAVVARTMLAGGVPYRDAWDFKPPGIFFIYAAARLVFGPGMWGIRIFEAIGLLSLVPAFVLLSRRCVGSWRPALPAFALAVMAYVQLEFWHTAQPESFAAFALIWALVLCTSEPAGAWKRSTQQTIVWVLVGLCYGIAGVLKPHLGGGILLTPFVLGSVRATEPGSRAPNGLTPVVKARICVAALRCSSVEYVEYSPSSRLGPLATARFHSVRQPVRCSRLRASLGPFLYIAVGGVIPLCMLVIYFGANGALHRMFDAVFVFVPQYSKLGYQNESVVSLLVHGVVDSLVRFSRHEAFGLLLLLLLPLLSGLERVGLLHILCVVCFPVLGVGLQAKFFPYHYGTIVPVLALPAAWGLWKLWLCCRPQLVSMLLFILVAWSLKDDRTAATYGSSLWTRNSIRLRAVLGDKVDRDAAFDRLHRIADVNPADNRRVADWLANNTVPSQSVFVWGVEPVIYDLAGRRSASRYIYNVPQRVPWAGWRRQELLDELVERRPKVVVLEEGDVFPWVTGNHRDSTQALVDFPALDALFRGNYEPGPRFGKFTTLVRRD